MAQSDRSVGNFTLTNLDLNEHTTLQLPDPNLQPVPGDGGELFLIGTRMLYRLNAENEVTAAVNFNLDMGTYNASYSDGQLLLPLQDHQAEGDILLGLDRMLMPQRGWRHIYNEGNTSTRHNAVNSDACTLSNGDHITAGGVSTNTPAPFNRAPMLMVDHQPLLLPEDWTVTPLSVDQLPVFTPVVPLPQPQPITLNTTTFTPTLEPFELRLTAL